MRGSGDGDGVSENLRENGRSGVGLIMKAFPRKILNNLESVNKGQALSWKFNGDHVMVSHVTFAQVSQHHEVINPS